VQSSKCLLTATRFNESLLLGRVNSCHGFHERIVIHASGFYTLTLSAEDGDNAANKLTAEMPSAPGQWSWGLPFGCCWAFLLSPGLPRFTRLGVKPCLEEVKPWSSM